jgi:HPt (histidine-containing phosphotransfer) domain-containing protein
VRKNPVSIGWDEFGVLDSESVDYRSGLQRIGGNRQLYGTLLRDLLTDHSEDGEQIRQAMENRDYERLNRLIHTLQGAAGNIGALRLEQLAEALSTTVMAGNPDSDLVGQFKNELDRVLTTIGQWLAQNDDRTEDAAGGSTMDLLGQQRAISQLEGLLVEHNGGAGKQWRLCRDVLGSRLNVEQLEQLEHQIADYDFDAALVTLRQADAEASSVLGNIRE